MSSLEICVSFMNFKLEMSFNGKNLIWRYLPYNGNHSPFLISVYLIPTPQQIIRVLLTSREVAQETSW
jgi:hypothetical protein